MTSTCHAAASRKGQPCEAGRVRRDEAGDTLIEVLIALAVIGLTAAALLGAFATSISASAEHRRLATIDTVLTGFAETATYQIQLQPSPLFQVSCPSSYTLAPSFTAPTGYTVAISSVQHWNGTSFTSCTTGSSTGPQLITATASGPSGSSDSLSFVVADPS